PLQQPLGPVRRNPTGKVKHPPTCLDRLGKRGDESTPIRFWLEGLGPLNRLLAKVKQYEVSLPILMPREFARIHKPAPKLLGRLRVPVLTFPIPAAFDLDPELPIGLPCVQVAPV